jgi:hypothetical protein
LAHNCLPTSQQLKKRNIPAYDLCCHCGRDETIEHIFFTCQYVADIWRDLKKICGLKRLLKPFVSPQQWIFEFLAGCTDREATIFVISLWHIWESRNVVRNGEREVHPHCLVEKILAYVNMVMLHMYDPVSSNRCDSVKPKYWSPPPEGWVMVNVDATIFQKANRMGLGIVVRDHKGEVLAARRQGINMITNPKLAESIAVRQAIHFTSEVPYNRVIIATDCLSLV